MWEIIAAVLLCLFATFGFVAFVKALIFKIYKPKSENAYLVLNAQENTQDIEYTLRSWEARLRWLGKFAPDNIVVVDNGLSEEQQEICRLISKECGIFKICTPIELYKIFYKKNT